MFLIIVSLIIILLILNILLTIYYLYKKNYKLFYISLTRTLFIYILIKLYCDYCNNIQICVFDSGIPGATIVAMATIHGNEPAGSYALEEVVDMFTSGELKVTKGKVIILPCLNKGGRMLNMRYQPQQILELKFFNIDANRNYPKKGEYSSKCDISTKVIDIVNKSNYVYDCHEAYGTLNKDGPNSMGNGIYPGNGQVSINLCNNIVKDINKIEYDTPSKTNIDYRTYQVVEKWKDIEGSLRNYCNDHEINYVLIESPGQDNVQPLKDRIIQNKIGFLSFMKNMDPDVFEVIGIQL